MSMPPPEALIAWEADGEPLEPGHGWPFTSWCLALLLSSAK